MNQKAINAKVARAFRVAVKTLDLEQKRVVVDPYCCSPFLKLNLFYLEYRARTNRKERRYLFIDTSTISQVFIEELKPKDLRTWIEGYIEETLN